MTIALIGAAVYPDPSSEPIRDGVVVVHSGLIEAVGPRDSTPLPKAAHVLDCTGLTITAGFWNSHVHFAERKWADGEAIPAPELTEQLRIFTRHGFTSVFDLSSLWKNTRVISERIEAGEAAGPAIRSTGEGMLPAGGKPPDDVNVFMGFMNIPLPEVTDAAQATQTAAELLGRGVDALKVFASAPSGATLSQDVMKAVADEAHAGGKLLFVHPNTSDDVLRALRAGCDVIAHTTPRGGPWTSELLREVERRRPALTPTLHLWHFFARHDRLSAQEQTMERAGAQLRDWIAAGGEVLFGTDLGAVDPDPAPEYELMERAGMNFRDILRSLTAAPAKRFGVKRTGAIAPGYAADLAAFKGNLSDMRYTLQRGRIVFGAEKA